jgi:hypothetical protein
MLHQGYFRVMRKCNISSLKKGIIKSHHERMVAEENQHCDLRGAESLVFRVGPQESLNDWFHYLGCSGACEFEEPGLWRFSWPDFRALRSAPGTIFRSLPLFAGAKTAMFGPVAGKGGRGASTGKA